MATSERDPLDNPKCTFEKNANVDHFIPEYKLTRLAAKKMRNCARVWLFRILNDLCRTTLSVMNTAAGSTTWGTRCLYERGDLLRDNKAPALKTRSIFKNTYSITT